MKRSGEPNLEKHGVDFTAAERFDWAGAIAARDERREYGEERIIAMGHIGSVLHVLIYTRRGESRRVISLRGASRNERKRYDVQKAR